MLTSGIFLACSSDDNSMVPEDIVSNYTYLDFASDKESMTQDEHSILISEAAKRMDKYVQLKQGQFRMSTSCTPEKVGLSPELFDYMKKLMHEQNDYIKEFKGNYYVTHQKTLVYTDKANYSPRLKTRSESERGGIDKAEIEVLWHTTTLHIYISYTTLVNATSVTAAASIIAGTVAGLAPPTMPVSVIVSAACGLSSVATARWASLYPNGVKITIVAPLHGALPPCIDYSEESQ